MSHVQPAINHVLNKHSAPHQTPKLQYCGLMVKAKPQTLRKLATCYLLNFVLTHIASLTDIDAQSFARHRYRPGPSRWRLQLQLAAGYVRQLGPKVMDKTALLGVHVPGGPGRNVILQAAAVQLQEQVPPMMTKAHKHLCCFWLFFGPR